MAGDDDNELPVAIAALAIAIAALLAASLQIAQAILASARGLPNCDERVMGGWSVDTHRRPRWSQLRLEVNFEAPIIFLSPHENEKGPGEGDMWSAEGTRESCAKSRVDYDNLSPEPNRTEQVHTVNNELASWVHLLKTIERMENNSKDWEASKRQKELSFPSWVSSSIPSPTLAVKIQKKQRSFETNPAIKKPYATTTISHLIELAAVLGLYWKVFDRDDNRYRAEGNGYSLIGSRVADFGIVFVFEQTGKTAFDKRRLIPTSEIKELCFGRVPTLFRRRTNEAEDVAWQDPLKTSTGINGLAVEILQLGTRDEIADTLTQIGCNVNTTLYYKDEKRHRHLFPVTFEVIGMVARTLHIKNRCFRFLPNPTIFSWDRDSLSLPRLLSAFANSIDRHLDLIRRKLDETDEKAITLEVENIKVLVEKSRALDKDFEYEAELTCPRMTALHDALDWSDEIIRAVEQEVVLDVLRRHLQEVLAAINNSTKEDISFGELLGLPLEMREERFMKIYFKRILWRVISTNDTSKGPKDQKQVSRNIHKDTENRRQSLMENGAAQPGNIPPVKLSDIIPMESSFKPHNNDGVPTPGLHERGSGSQKLDNEMTEQTTGQDTDELNLSTTVASQREMKRLTIWYTLVFRMVCWLTLHDFDKRDLQVPESGLMGNRQPVFIM